jgi:TPR repeat protein
VLQDFVQARLWLGLAADNGDTEAAANLERLANKLTPSQVAESERMAKERQPNDG